MFCVIMDHIYIFQEDHLVFTGYKRRTKEQLQNLMYRYLLWDEQINEKVLI